MRKNLLKTSALVGAGLLIGAGVGQGANAQEAAPFELKASGSFQVYLGAQDEDDGIGQPANGFQDTVFATDGEIRFTAKSTLDNGLKIAARVEYEAHNQGGGGSIVDERWLRFEGGFGQLKIGHDDDAAYAMHYQAPVGAYQIGVNTPTFGIPQVGVNLITSYSSTYPGLGSDGNKVLYFTPRVQGFQLGLSYAPQQGNAANDTPALTPTDNDIGEQEDIFSVGVNYVSELNGVDVAISVGYNNGSLENNLTTTLIFGATTVTLAGVFDDREQWVAGVNVGFAGFTVGASYLNDDRGIGTLGPLGSDFDLDIWDVGVSYSTGPYTIGVTYLHAEAEFGILGDDELDAWVVSGTYNMGPGVNLWAGVKQYDFESAINFAGAENEALFGSIGATVSF